MFAIRKAKENIRAWRGRNWKSLKQLDGCSWVGRCVVGAGNVCSNKLRNLWQSDTKRIEFVTWVSLRSRTAAAGRTGGKNGCKEAARPFTCHGARTENMAVRLVAL